MPDVAAAQLEVADQRPVHPGVGLQALGRGELGARGREVVQPCERGGANVSGAHVLVVERQRSARALDRAHWVSAEGGPGLRAVVLGRHLPRRGERRGTEGHGADGHDRGVGGAQADKPPGTVVGAVRRRLRRPMAGRQPLRGSASSRAAASSPIPIRLGKSHVQSIDT